MTKFSALKYIFFINMYQKKITYIIPTLDSESTFEFWEPRLINKVNRIPPDKLSTQIINHYIRAIKFSAFKYIFFSMRKMIGHIIIFFINHYIRAMTKFSALKYIFLLICIKKKKLLTLSQRWDSVSTFGFWEPRLINKVNRIPLGKLSTQIINHYIRAIKFSALKYIFFSMRKMIGH